MSDQLYKLKPLDWVDDVDGDASTRTILGNIYVRKEEHSGWKWGYCFDEYYDADDFSCDDKADGIAKANAYYLSRIMDALIPSRTGGVE